MAPVVLLLLAGGYFGLGGCLFSSGRHELRAGSMSEYRQSEVSRWIAIPTSSVDITTYRFLGFDTNYRFLMASVPPESADLAELCSRSLALQSVGTNVSMTIRTNIQMSGFEILFGKAPRAVPSWWKTDKFQNDRQYICMWESTNHYGYGYLFLLDSKNGTLRAFQWIQQWNTISATMKALEK